MNKVIKWILIGCAGMLGLVIIALLVIPLFVDLNTYKPVMEEKVSEATGRTFQIGSDLKLSLFPWAGISFSDLQLGNPKGFKETGFLQIASFEVRVKLLPLLSRNIEVQKFIVTGPHLNLVKKRDGSVNWDFSQQPGTPARQPSEPESAPDGEKSSGLPIEKLAVGNFSINDGTVIYIDQIADTRNEVADFNLSLQDVSFDKPISLKLSARVDNRPVGLSGTVGPIGKNPGRGSIGLDLVLKALEILEVKLKGNVTDPAENPNIDLALDVSPFSLPALMGKLEQSEAVKTTDPKALTKIALKAQIKAGPKAVSIADGKLSLDDSNLDFTLQASEFAKPNLAFDLNLDRIDLDRYLPPESKKASPPESAQDQKPAPKAKKNDYTALRRLILDGQLKAGSVIINKATLNRLVLKVKAKNGIIRLDPFSLGAYQGEIAGSGVFDVRRTVPASSLQMRISDLQVAPLLKEQMGKDILEGTTNADVSMQMNGDDPDRIKKTLSGKGQLSFTDGAIVGFDLAGMARNAKAAFGLEQPAGQKPRTDFSELLVPFTLRKGVFTTTQTRMNSPFLRLLAAGNADLVKERLDFRIEPKLVGTMKGQGDQKQRSGITVPVLVSGTFMEPSFKPDLKGMAQQQIEKKVLEHKEVKKIFKKKELQPLEDKAKGLMKGLFGN